MWLLSKIGSFLIVLAMLNSVRTCAASSAQTPSSDDIAIVHVVKSDVYWAPLSFTKPFKGILISGSHPLKVGEWIRCGHNGIAQLYRYDENHKKYSMVPFTSIEWYPIVNVPPGMAERSARAIPSTIRRAGSPRDTPLILSPAEGGTSSPDTFTFRWSPFKKGTHLVLTLWSPQTGTQLWQESGVDGPAGKLASDAARVALNQWVTSGGQGKLIFTLESDTGEVGRTRFSLLSAAREQSLKTEMARWSADPHDVLYHLDRAAVFYDFDLYPESAEEYQAALDMEPENIIVRQRTAEAYKMYGDLTHAKQIAGAAK